MGKIKTLLVGLILIGAFFLYTHQTPAEIPAYSPPAPQKALIILHGYSQDGSRLQWMTEQLKTALPDTAFYYPTAPQRAPYQGYQWFALPLTALNLNTTELYGDMLDGAVKNISVLHHIIDSIHNSGIAYQNISIAGFSQGGLMAVLAGVTYKHRIGKVVSLSGVPLVFTENFGRSDIKSTPQILLIQGNRDTVVPPDSITMTTESLNKTGIRPQTALIEGLDHSITQPVLQKMINFLR